MSGLAHYLEDEGLSTTQISLIREHTEIIKPPRALWVPFELGRPLGAPDAPEFQTRVLLETLKLLEANNGPVLKDFPEDAPAAARGIGEVACPVDFGAVDAGGTEEDPLLAAFQREVRQLRSWYGLAVEKRGRTTANTTGMTPEEVAEFLAAFVRGERPGNPMRDVSLGTAVRLAAHDLEAYYEEAVGAQPGQPTDSAPLADWFWSETRAAHVIGALRDSLMAADDEELQMVGERLLVPRAQLHRFQRR